MVFNITHICCVAILLLVLGPMHSDGQTQPAGSAEAGKTGPSSARQVSAGITAPRVTYGPDPEYSKEAQAAGYQGICVLWLIVGPDGKPHDIRVARRLGLGLEEKAIEAVQRWRFEPAQ